MNLVSMLKQVVLPAPLGPIRAWIEPRLTRSATSLTAWKSPKLLAEALGDENVVVAHPRQPPRRMRLPPIVIEYDSAIKPLNGLL